MESVTRGLAEFIVGTKYEDLPPEVVYETKRAMLDSIGCTLAGRGIDRGRISAEVAGRLGGPAESLVLGTNRKVPAPNAAFANGEAMYGGSFEVCSRGNIQHITPAVLPAALAVSESREASGRGLILATVMAHDIPARIAAGLATRRVTVVQGVELTPEAVYGDSANIFGAAASAGKVMGLDVDKMINALGIAGYNAPVSSRSHWHSSPDAFFSLLRGFSPGWMAQGGITAALLAEAGFTGSLTVLDGDNGFWKFSGSHSWNPEAVTRGLGKQWPILNISYKLYPGCGVFHSALDCFVTIVEDNDLKPQEIESVKAWVHPLFLRPLCTNRDPVNEVQAQFSMAYIFSLAAHRVPRGMEWYATANMKDPQIRAFMDKVTYSPYQQENPTGGASGEIVTESTGKSRVEVAARGRTYHAERSYRRGLPVPADARMSDDDLNEKFRHNASGVLSKKKTNTAIECLWNLEKLKNLSLLMNALAAHA